jgi:hypothetical protein
MKFQFPASGNICKITAILRSQQQALYQLVINDSDILPVCLTGQCCRRFKPGGSPGAENKADFKKLPDQNYLKTGSVVNDFNSYKMS